MPDETGPDGRTCVRPAARGTRSRRGPTAPDPEQVADVYAPTADRPGRPWSLVHGGFWRPDYDRTHLRPLAAALADVGYLVVSLEYRRSPGQPDAEPIADLRRPSPPCRTC